MRALICNVSSEGRLLRCVADFLKPARELCLSNFENLYNPNLATYVCTLSDSDRYSYRIATGSIFITDIRQLKSHGVVLPHQGNELVASWMKENCNHHLRKRLNSAAAGLAAQPGGEAAQPAECSSTIPPLPSQLAAQSRPPPSRCPAVDQFVATIRAPVGMPCLISRMVLQDTTPHFWRIIPLHSTTSCTAAAWQASRCSFGSAWKVRVFWQKNTSCNPRRMASKVRSAAGRPLVRTCSCCRCAEAAGAATSGAITAPTASTTWWTSLPGARSGCRHGAPDGSLLVRVRLYRRFPFLSASRADEHTLMDTPWQYWQQDLEQHALMARIGHDT